MDNELTLNVYEVPEIIEEGVLEIRAGSPTGFPEDPFDLDF